LPNLEKVVVTWAGFTGAPGYSIFYGTGAATLLPDLGTFFNAIKAAHPAPLQFQFPASGFILDEATGHQTGTWTATPPAAITATGTGSYVGTTGPVVSWRTGTITPAGKLLRGRTFFAPVITGQFDGNGGIVSTCVTLFQNAATTLAAAGHLRIYHRPVAGAGGMSGLVTAGVVTNLPAVMKSRRR